MPEISSTVSVSHARQDDAVADELGRLFESLSGEAFAPPDRETSFLDLGLDSLFLAQVATKVQSAFGITVTFRQLLGELPSLGSLARYIAAKLPPAALPVERPTLAAVQQTMQVEAGATPTIDGALPALLRDQMAAMQALFTQQLQVIGSIARPQATQVVANSTTSLASSLALTAPSQPILTDGEVTSRLDVYRSAKPPLRTLEPSQRAYIDELTERYTSRTIGSKQATARNREVLADPRAAAGFRQDWKEMVYPITCIQAIGSRIVDVDENSYVDLVNGYGQTMLGHAPSMVIDAVAHQLDLGFAIGPQSPLAGEVAALVHRLTGNDRVTFCNTGSEAVMAAIRVARTATGRDTVVMFEGAYHGQFDEVVVKKAKRDGQPGSAPAAAGIPTASVCNVVVLPYATDESLAWIREHGETLAAVVIEPVQSRHPGLVPVEFLGQLRQLTAACGVALVFDEVVTGFRVHPGGAQALFGIRADLATYGKVVGGGLPIGILAGKRAFMDALDGGTWTYGDDTYPEVAPTFFAGTFVRHPLALAAARAVLTHLDQQGPLLQDGLRSATERLVVNINSDLAERGFKTRVETFSSWFYFNPAAEDRLASLFFYEARSRGVHIQEGFPCFLTTAHNAADVELIRRVFRESLDALVMAGIPAGTTLPASLSAPDEAPWTEPQKEIWLAAQLSDAASCAFNESVTLTFEGNLDETRLIGVLQDVFARHDALRVRFEPATETMHLIPDATFPLQSVDLRDRENATVALESLRQQDATKPFDLLHGPVVRATLVALRDRKHALLLTAHHIVFDGWSINVFIEDIGSLYAARADGHAAALPDAPSFLAYARQQRDNRSNTCEAYWLKQFQRLPPALDLPGDRPRPPQKSYRGATHNDIIPGVLLRSVKAAGARLGCTLFATLLGAMQIVVTRLSGESDVVIAIPAAGQSAADAPHLVGHCVNLLPIRSFVGATSTIREHLTATRNAVLDAFENQDVTFGTVVRELNAPRSQNRLPLTQLQFNLERLSSGPSVPGLTLSVTPNGKRFSNFDFFANFVEEPDGLRVDCDYSTDLFDGATIARWMSHLRHVLQAIAENADRPVWSVPLMSASELQTLVSDANPDEPPEARLVPTLVRNHAERTPDAVAVSWRDTRLTYAELDAAVDRLTHRILRLDLDRRSRIVVATSRSPRMLVAMLAIWRAGHAYVPLDVAQPRVRQNSIVDDAQVGAVICDGSEDAAAFARYPVINLEASDDDQASEPVRPLASPGLISLEDTAYVIFTSGSTGRPKGVEIPHGALNNLLHSMRDRPGFNPDDTWLAVTTIGFDIAAAELFVPLVVGGHVVIADRAEVTDGFALVARIEQCGATVVQATPSLWRILIEAGFRSRPGLTMIAGGEPLPRDLADLLLEGGGRLWNAYGPTETTIWSSFENVRAGDRSVPIGHPACRTQLLVLDDHMQLTPLGVEGELFIGGAGLANGYFARADLTAEAFPTVALPGRSPQRLYRTGDRARRMGDATLHLLGRRDSQVKLRGFRIELGEIESVLRGCPGISDAAVCLRSTGDAEPYLVAYLVETSGGTSDLAGFAAARLPDYMVPQVWMRLPALPVSANGKLDRGALPEPPAAAAVRPVVERPRTETERRLAAVIQGVLGGTDVGIHDNLFALGANSLQIFRIAARFRQEKLGLAASDLMRSPTIAALAEAVERGDAQGNDFGAVPSLRSFRRRAKSISEAAL